MLISELEAALRCDKKTKVPPAEVAATNIVVITKGHEMPVDGTIEGGMFSVDQVMLANGLVPADKEVGDTVIGASINKNATSQNKATKVGADTTRRQIVQARQKFKTSARLSANRAVQWWALDAIIVGLGTSEILFLLTGQPLLFAVSLTITVIVIVIMVWTERKKQNLFKNTSALEAVAMQRADIVLMKSYPFVVSWTTEFMRPMLKKNPSAPRVDGSLQRCCFTHFGWHPAVAVLLSLHGKLVTQHQHTAGCSRYGAKDAPTAALMNAR